MSRCPWAAVALALLALAAPPAQAATQDPGTYPDGILAVSHTAVRAGSDFQVAVEVDGAADTVHVYVCSFRSAQAEAPDVCYMPLGARRSEAAATTWTASTAAVEHPAWKDGAALGYKVQVRRAGGDLHAPDRTISSGDYDYYRVVVGQEGSAAQGSAVVEDGIPGQQGAEDAPATDAPVATVDEKDAPAPAAAGLLLLLALAAVGLRRR